MDNLLVSVFLLIGLSLTVLMCYQESKNRKISFVGALLLCIIATPLIGYFIISNFRSRNPKGCKWCGNERNEVEFCGVCKKNIEGVTKISVGADNH